MKSSSPIASRSSILVAISSFLAAKSWPRGLWSVEILASSLTSSTGSNSNGGYVNFGLYLVFLRNLAFSSSRLVGRRW